MKFPLLVLEVDRSKEHLLTIKKIETFVEPLMEFHNTSPHFNFAPLQQED